ncbi:HPr kinase/phosphorylase [Martelella mediterranea]|uniref:Hpr(Ser) kinase/phosphatase n=1 Tax=Martelella mediterranea TaxID=293089 RepID=A0A4R3NWV1_9HYPH|nr:HPr kinase/phosphorylase [Martelella mediterranea]TCT44557.1 Hpr(Ser) kinase/phosphatase [Martelella mediterranea]
MTDARERINRHATAIVIGSTGIAFIGPPGAGKSECALACLRAAGTYGLFSRLIADDQIFVSAANGRIIAETPQTIAGQIEVRGTGIARLPYISAAVIDFAVSLVRPDTAERMPPVNQRWAVTKTRTLPQINLTWPSPDPLSRLMAACPGLETGQPAVPGLLV